jgi:hypothetical protein
VKRLSGQRSALERRVWQLIDDMREALRLGEPGAVDAIDQLELGARALCREQQGLVEDADRHREADDEG